MSRDLEKLRAAQRRYNASDRARAAQRRYRAGRGRIVEAIYDASERGLARHRAAQARYKVNHPDRVLISDSRHKAERRLRDYGLL